MPLRFTIRDVLWLTVDVALVMGWALDHFRHEQYARENIAHQKNIEMLENALDVQKTRNQQMFERYEAKIRSLEGPRQGPPFPSDQTP